MASILSFSLILSMAASAAIASAPSDSTAIDTLATIADSWSSLRLVPRGALATAHGDHGEVVEPAGVSVDAFGRVWVTDAQLHRIQRFDRDGRWLGEAGALGSDVGQLRRPGSVAA